MQIYLTAAPAEEHAAAACRLPLAHAAYRIGPDSCLLRQNLLLQAREGLLGLTDRGAPEIPQPELLSAALVRECRRRSYRGVLADFEDPPTPDRTAFLSALDAALSAAGLTLYAPETWAAQTTSAVSVISAAVSGGSFLQHLRESVAAAAPRRIALDLERLRMDFVLPAREGVGTPLTAEALARLIRTEAPAVFFSPELCARYFTYLKGGEAHFVLFDDADTLKRKLRLGAQCGCGAAFLLWPEISDLADAHFPGSP